MKVRFLRPKTYPHGTGRRRLPGEVVEIPDDKAGKALARQWIKTKIVEQVKDPPKPPAKPVKDPAKPTGEKGGDKPGDEEPK